MDDAIRGALAKNPVIKVQDYQRSIARADVLTAYGQFDPALAFRRSHGDNELPGTTLAPGLPSVTGRIQSDNYSLALEGLTPWGLTYSLGGDATNQRGTFNGFTNNFETFGGLAVTQPLLRDFIFGFSLTALRLAKADRSISEWDYRQVVIDTVTRVILAYNDLALANETLRITQRSRALAQALLSNNEKRLNAGQMSQSDVTEAAARAAQREENIIIASRNVADAANSLRQLLGEDVMGVGPLEIVPPGPAPNVTVVAADDLKVAYAQRPDYLAARLGVQKTRFNATYARNQLLPRLDFIGSYGYAGMDEDFSTSRRQVREGDNAVWSAGMVVRVPLTFAEGRGRARSARLQKEQAEADLRRFEQDIAVVVANAAGQIDTTQRRVAATQRAYELGAQQLEAAEKKLTAGSTTTFVVANFQEILTSLDSARARALTDHRKALANYDRALGRTLEQLGITLEKN